MLDLDDDIDVTLRLPWRTTCRLAVKAAIMGVSFNDVCEFALAQHLYGWIE